MTGRYGIELWPGESGKVYCVVEYDDDRGEYSSVVDDSGSDLCFDSRADAERAIKALQCQS